MKGIISDAIQSQCYESDKKTKLRDVMHIFLVLSARKQSLTNAMILNFEFKKK